MSLRTENMNEYQSWKGMRERVRNPNSKTYCRYGGRGISICEEWMSSFEAFLMDMGKKPSKQHQLDRIANDGDYNKGNCSWATCRPPGHTSSVSKRWVVNGVVYKSLSEANKDTGIPIATVKAMCDGVTVGGVFYPPKDECHSKKVYE